jgi:topoisomerase IV subunit B
VSPIFAGESLRRRRDDAGFAEGEGAAWALAWCEAGGEGESFVNLIPTRSAAPTKPACAPACSNRSRSSVEHHGLLTRGVKPAAEDVWKPLRYVLSARMLDPQFQGQTKDKLSSREAVKLVASRGEGPARPGSTSHVEAGKKIAELAIKRRLARQKAGKVVEKRRSSGVAVLPGKLTDCESEDMTRNEVFLVEGDSAGGSAKQGRDREYQAILPLRGKVLNTWEVDARRALRQQRGARHRGRPGHRPASADAPDAVLDNLRYGKVIIMADADVDGSPHPDPAAHPVLPPLPEADRARPRLHRPAAALQHQGGPHGKIKAGAAPLCPRRGERDADAERCARRACATTSTSAASRAWAR